MPSVEQDFLRFRDRGDLHALAAVFDALAPQLLLVASHLVRDGALAEDLLQTTFVEAMRSAGRYDARRPLLPWLSRILTNQAHKLQRVRRRAPDPRRLAKPNGEDPFTAAHGREVAEAVQSALGQLPLGYRQVLVLRLVHELQPAAIAHALGCPPETVKTRLKRGMELLRRQLPKGIGAALAAFATNGRGLAAVRAAVLERGSALLRATRFVPWSLLGMLAMKQIVARALLVTALVVFGLWGVVLAWPDGNHAAARSTAVPTLLHAPAPPLTDAAIADNERHEVAVVPAAPQVSFRGRCLDATSHAPLAGCRATVSRKPISLDRSASVEFAIRHPVEAEVVTGLDGCFELDIGLDAEAKYVVDVAAADRVGRQREFGPWTDAHIADLGDLDMHLGVALSGTVVDQAGHPVPDVPFLLRGVFHERYCPLQDRFGWNLRSGADGSYELPYPLAPGEWWVFWFENSIPAERQNVALHLAPAPSVQHVDLVLPVEDDAQSIRGRVRDTEGSPVSWLDLRALGAGTLGLARTDARGEFVIRRIGPYDAAARGPVEITLDDPISGHELAVAATHAWGDRDVSLVVRPARSLTVRPIDGRTGATLIDCNVLCAAIVPQEGGESEQAVAPPSRHLAGGEIVLALSPHPHLLRVLPRDQDLVPSDVIRWQPGQGESVEIQVPRSVRARVHVVAQDGSPVAGSVIWALRAADKAATPSLPVVRDLIAAPFDRWLRSGVVDEPLDHGATDGQGLVTLRACAQGATVFAALGPGHVPQAFSLVVPGDLQVTLTVDRAAALRCRFTPDEVVCAYLPTEAQRERERQFGGSGHVLEVHVSRSATEQRQDSWQAPATLDVARDGTCHGEGLPPGTYDLTLEARRPCGFDDGVMVHLSLGSVALQAGKMTEVDRDLAELRSCHVRGRVYMNGEPWAGHEASLEARSGDRDAGAQVATDAEGRFEADTIAGRNRLRLRYRAVGNMGYWFAAEEVMVTPGHVTDAVFNVRRVVASVRILDAGGAPVSGLQVAMYTEGQPTGWQAWTTDGDGRIAIDPAPIKPFALIVRSSNAPAGIAAKLPGASKDAQLGPFSLPATGNEASFEARLPEGWR